MSKKYLGKYCKDWLHKDTSSDRSCRCCRNCCRSQLESLNRTLNRKDLRDRSSEDRRASCQVGVESCQIETRHMERIRKIWQKDIRSIGKYLRVILIAQVHSRFDASKSVARSPAALRGFWGGPCQFHNSWNMLEQHATSSKVSCGLAVCQVMAPLRTTASRFGRPAAVTHGLHGWHGSPCAVCFEPVLSLHPSWPAKDSNGHGEDWTVTIKMQCRIQIGHKRIYKRTSGKKRANIQKDM